MDLQEQQQTEAARQVARVRERARPWRSIIAGILALAAFGVATYGPFRHGHVLYRFAWQAGAVLFCLLGIAAAVGLSGKVRDMLRPVLGSAHAAIIRYALVLLSGVTILIIALQLLDVRVGQLIVGGALTGVLIGIAGQQALANVFAGIVLLFARPFAVGDRVQVRSSALNGPLVGTVTEISITYVRLRTADGILHLPNSQVLAAAVGPAGSPTPDATASGATAADAARPEAAASGAAASGDP